MGAYWKAKYLFCGIWSSWWFQPIWKICSSKWVEIFPKFFGLKNKKYLSCHHPEQPWTTQIMTDPFFGGKSPCLVIFSGVYFPTSKCLSQEPYPAHHHLPRGKGRMTDSMTYMGKSSQGGGLTGWGRPISMYYILMAAYQAKTITSFITGFLISAK